MLSHGAARDLAGALGYRGPCFCCVDEWVCWCNLGKLDATQSYSTADVVSDHPTQLELRQCGHGLKDLQECDDHEHWQCDRKHLATDDCGIWLREQWLANQPLTVAEHGCGRAIWPTSAGSVTGTLTIISDATSSPNVNNFSGTGATVVPHSVDLSWAASTSTVSGYNIYRSAVTGGSYFRMNSSLIGALTYSDSTVQSGQTYYYVATAVESAGNESGYSNEVSANVP